MRREMYVCVMFRRNKNLFISAKFERLTLRFFIRVNYFIYERIQWQHIHTLREVIDEMLVSKNKSLRKTSNEYQNKWNPKNFKVFLQFD